MALSGLSGERIRLEDTRLGWTQWVRDETILVSGELTRLQAREVDAVLWLRVDSLRPPTEMDWVSLTGGVGGRFVLSNQPESWREGTALTLSVRLDRIRGRRNPGQFDFASWMRSNGWRLTGDVLSVLSARPPPLGIRTIRSAIRSTVLSQYAPDTAPFVLAFVLGDRSLLASDVRQSFSRAGLSHIMAVSGLHVGFVLAPIWFLIQALGTGPSSRAAGFVLLCATLGFYSLLTGMSTSVIRASVMAILFGGARLFHLPAQPLNVLCASAFLLLSVRPGDLLEPGFQLSYSAVFLLLTWMPSVTDRLENGIQNVPMRWLVTMMSVTLIVQTGMAPLLAGWFGEISWVAPLSNLATVPLLSVLMTGSIVLLLTGQWLTMPEWVILPFDLAYRWILWVPEVVGRDASYVFPIRGFSAWAVACWLFVLSSLAPRASSWARWRRLRWALVMLLCGAAWNARSDHLSNGLAITILDVGQGDAAHISLPGGGDLLIDTGWTMGDSDAAQWVLLPYLESEGVDSLTSIWLTHPHADHIGGAVTLAGSLPIGTVFQSPVSYASSVTTRLDSTLSAEGVPARVLTAGDWLDLGHGVGVFVLHPPAGGEWSVNDASLVVRVVYGETSFLFAGDAERRAEVRMVDSFAPFLASDVLKTGHHGSRTSTSARFLDAVAPRHSVVSVALDNRYGLPDREVFDRLSGSDTKAVWYTSRDGAITFFSDSKKIRMMPCCP